MPSSRLIGAACVLLSLAFVAKVEAADRIEPAPEELAGVDLTEKLGAKLPLDAEFTDDHGDRRTLGQLLDTGKPTILTFNYTNCPMLCNVQLSGLVDTMIQTEWSVGEEYSILTISLDPKEDPELMSDSKAQYLERYGRPNAAKGWRFARGSEEQIRKVTDSVGFGYAYHSGRKEYLHPAALILLSPNNSVSGYLYGVNYNAKELHGKLISAGMGKVSESANKFILSCYHYDAPKGNGVIATNIMRYGGLIFVVGFAFAIAVFGIKRSKDGALAHQVGSTEDHV